MSMTFLKRHCVLEKWSVMLVLDKDTSSVCEKLDMPPKGANVSRLMLNVIPDSITLLLAKINE